MEKSKLQKFYERQERNLVRSLENEQKSLLEKCVIVEDGKINSVNWDEVIKLEIESPSYHENILDYLRIKGHLSWGREKGDFMIAYEGMDLSPAHGLIYFHFKSEEEAKKYLHLKYGKARYHPNVVQILR